MNLKERLQAKKAKLENRYNAITSQLVSENDAEVRNGLGETLKALRDDINEIEAMLADIDEPADPAAKADEGEGRSFNVLGSFANRSSAIETSNKEYRNAFKSYIANGNKAELRAAAGNTTGDVDSVIPENLVDQIIEKIEAVGSIYKLVTRTNYAVGQTIARESLKPQATWVGVAKSNSGEGEGSNVAKATLDAAIVFANFKLRCEVAMTEEVASMTLAAFETLFVKNVSAAMIRAIESAIVDGTGVGQPTGILTAEAPEGQVIELAAADELSYKTLCDAEGAIPAAHEAGAKWCMTKKTFMSFVGMTDTVGQPIARTNYGVDGKPERTLLGREVVLYEPQGASKLGNYADSVSADTTFAFIFDFSDYVLNNNYNLGIQHKTDWDNEDHRTKAVAAYDGKIIDNASLVILKKLNA